MSSSSTIDSISLTCPGPTARGKRRARSGTVLLSLAALGCSVAAEDRAGNLGEPIDREALVARHNPHITRILPMSPLHIGNGSMVFTADFTGLQTFHHHYERGLPLQTVAEWAWNQFPNENKIPFSALMKDGRYQERPVKLLAATEPSDIYYRRGIHRFNLGRIGLDLMRENGGHMFTAELTELDQRLDLWRGVIDSRFRFDGEPIRVQTTVHPDEDILAIRIESPLVKKQRCNLKIEFPYPRGSKDLPTDLFERSMLPRWFQPERDGWELLPDMLQVHVLGSDVPFRVYRKHFPAGTHTFGGNNRADAAVGGSVIPLIGNPDGGTAREFFDFNVSTTKERYRLVPGGVTAGQPVWTDRDYAISSVGDSLEGLDLLMCSNLDEDVHRDDHFTFTLAKPLDVHLAWQWHPDRHSTTIQHQEFGKTDILRQIDGTSNHVSIQHSQGIRIGKVGANQLTVDLSASEDEVQEIIISFSCELPLFRLPAFEDVARASARSWKRFWTTGGAIDLSGSTDPRASELERRIVLSQYLTAITCSGKDVEMPSGLSQITYFGSGALEVTQWNRAHFPFWGRDRYLENIMDFYRRTLPAAKWHAEQCGFDGAAYPKGIVTTGRASPAGFDRLYVTHVPNPIYYLESLYRNNRSEAFLEEWSELVFEVADFIASTMKWDPVDGHYDLGPGIEPQQEGHHSGEILNPTFEVAFLIWGLEVAQQWRERLDLPLNDKWQQILDHMAPLPKRDGLYLVSENFQDTWANPARRANHLSHLNTFGFLPQVHDLDKEVMRATLHRTLEPDGWNWANSFGFNYPHVAMCAARLGDAEAAIDILFRHTEGNQWMPSGSVPIHARGIWAIRTVPAANGNLLLAMAMMAAGWDGAPERHAPGFPDNGMWKVRWEGLRPTP